MKSKNLTSFFTLLIRTNQLLKIHTNEFLKTHYKSILSRTNQFQKIRTYQLLSVLINLWNSILINTCLYGSIPKNPYLSALVCINQFMKIHTHQYLSLRINFEKFVLINTYMYKSTLTNEFLFVQKNSRKSIQMNSFLQLSISEILNLFNSYRYKSIPENLCESILVWNNQFQ